MKKPFMTPQQFKKFKQVCARIRADRKRAEAMLEARRQAAAVEATFAQAQRTGAVVGSTRIEQR